MIKIVSPTEEYYEKILSLNEELVHFLSDMDLNKYLEMSKEATLNKVALIDNQFAGFIMAFCEGKKYDSVNYKWFEQRYDKFLYVDRIVISPCHHGKGVGKELYKKLFLFAKENGYDIVTCEINIEPPNPGSLEFHKKMGFKEVGTQSINGKGSNKIVSLQAVSL